MNYSRDDETIVPPFKKHITDAGWDLHAPYGFTLKPGEVSERIDLGVSFQGIPDAVGIVSERSSQGKVGVHTLGNIVDYGYIGNVHVTLVNTSKESDYVVQKGDRICQIIFVKNYTGELNEVPSLDNVGSRGKDAHGSTGV